METTGCRLMIDHDRLHPYAHRFSISAGTNNVESETTCSASPQTRSASDIPGLAAIFFTSGSSGSPKGVMLSHTNLLANAESIQRSLPMESTDRTLALLPFCHAYGNSVLQSHLLCGAALVVAGSTAFPETIVDAMQSHSVTSFAGVPQLHQLIFRGSRISTEEVPSLRYVTVAGGALRRDLISEFADRIYPAKFYVMYGQTEATARLSCLPAEELNTRRGSIGRGIPGVTLEVVDRQGNPVATGVRGEIRASGDNIMLGYWNDPAATREVLRNNWLYTGDLAVVDEDGFIYPKGRKNQLLKIAGYRLHPAEIEAAITTQMPSVEAFVVPFEAADGMTRLALFVAPLERTNPPDSKEIRRCCRDHLARFQRPDYISVLKRVPLTPSMKVDRQKLSKMATDAMQQRRKTTDALAR
jgi:acyl-CoA synthetase (AMP-forming)/AMP-acid ligase II